MELTRATERVLKLALPNHLIWLIFFYLLFHSFLNTTGEVLSFADRNFYSDWWNADDLFQFWKMWNLPVHRWAVRHLFKPILRRGYSSFQVCFSALKKISCARAQFFESRALALSLSKKWAALNFRIFLNIFVGLNFAFSTYWQLFQKSGFSGKKNGIQRNF